MQIIIKKNQRQKMNNHKVSRKVPYPTLKVYDSKLPNTSDCMQGMAGTFFHCVKHNVTIKID